MHVRFHFSILRFKTQLSYKSLIVYTKGLKCCNSLMHLTRLLLCIKISLLGYECQKRFYRLQLAIILQAMPKVTSSKVIWKMMIWPFTPSSLALNTKLKHTVAKDHLMIKGRRCVWWYLRISKRRRSAAFNFAVRHHSETADLLEKQAWICSVSK